MLVDIHGIHTSECMNHERTYVSLFCKCCLSMIHAFVVIIAYCASRNVFMHVNIYKIFCVN